MTRQLAHDVLRRMASPPPPAPEDVPITSSKAVRLAITRAADKTHSMVISVSSLQEEVVGLDDLLAAFDPDLMLLAMVAGDRIQGIAAIGPELRAALLELQTIGRVLDMAAEPRKPTEADARLSEPLVTAFLAHLGVTAAQTPLDGWGDGFVVGDKLTSARAAGLILDDGQYRVIRIALDLGVADRVSELAIALPSRSKAAEKIVKPEVSGDWTTRFQAVVNGSPAQLDALLHTFKMPLFRAESLSVGQVIPLTGCTVSSIKLLAADGRRVATARLGQSGGMRAVRIEQAPHVQMEDMDTLTAGGGSGGGAPLVPDLPLMTDNDPMGHDSTIDIPPVEMMQDPLSWEDADDAQTPTPMGDAAPLSWADEDFEPPQD